MRMAVLGTSDSWYFRDLARAAQESGRQLVAVPFESLSSSLDPSKRRDRGNLDVRSGEFNLATFDAVIVRTMPPGSLEQVVFRMNALARLELLGIAIVNPPRSLEAAVDKYLTSALLDQAGLPTPRTYVCQTASDAIRAFSLLGGDVVLKPIFGSEGRGIARLQDEALAERAFRMVEQLGGVLYLQEFIAHEGFDLRLLVVGERVLGIRRRNPHDWRTNCSRGATAEPMEVTPDLAGVAQRAAAAVGASVAGVDLLVGRDGTQFVIEVNAVPGWKALASALQVDVARLVLEHVAETVATFRKRRGR
ncbi:MAG: 30S ribosomal protein S6--L-glutamate ligase [Pirellula sp.]|nr:30S ribosomal protein S6--L-glutamate ligase [Pirellula sp.]